MKTTYYNMVKLENGGYLDWIPGSSCFGWNDDHGGSDLFPQIETFDGIHLPKLTGEEKPREILEALIRKNPDISAGRFVLERMD